MCRSLQLKHLLVGVTAFLIGAASADWFQPGREVSLSRDRSVVSDPAAIPRHPTTTCVDSQPEPIRKPDIFQRRSRLETQFIELRRSLDSVRNELSTATGKDREKLLTKESEIFFELDLLNAENERLLEWENFDGSLKLIYRQTCDQQ
jgi:hypothetical protein